MVCTQTVDRSLLRTSPAPSQKSGGGAIELPPRVLALSMADERFDPLLLQMCQGHDSMASILNTFFSFLHRKTDFYEVLQGDARVGFPPGVADKMVVQAFTRYKEQQSGAPSRAALEAELERKHRREAVAAKTSAPAPAPPPERKKTPLAESKKKPPAAAAPASTAAPVPAPVPAKAGADTRQEPLAPYNGAQEEGYTWAQTSVDVTVQLFVPKGTRAKELDVNFTASKLSVKLKSGSGDALIDGELFEKIAVDECTWSLEVGNGEMTITMEKVRERWWKTVIVGQGATEIDTTKVDSVKSIDEYDGETQGAIRKIMYDQDQKAKGLKTSDEMSQEDMLKQAWDAPGSPFAGQPFNPEAVNWGAGGGPDGPDRPGGLPASGGPDR